MYRYADADGNCFCLGHSIPVGEVEAQVLRAGAELQRSAAGRSQQQKVRDWLIMGHESGSADRVAAPWLELPDGDNILPLVPA